MTTWSSTNGPSETKLLALAVSCFVATALVSSLQSLPRPETWLLLLLVLLTAFAAKFKKFALVAVLCVLALGVRSAIEVAEYQQVASGGYSGLVEVASEPESVGIAGARLTVKLLDGSHTGSRVEVTANGQPAWDLFSNQVGDQVRVEGKLGPREETSFRKASHIEGQLKVGDVGNVEGVAGLQVVPQLLRAQVERVAQTLSFDNQALFNGLVVGDDSEQSLSERSTFAASGLTHLLAVSGQNVAFVLLILRPVLRVLPLRSRTALALLALVMFALVTRLEPSVLRAITMTSISLWATLTGRKASGLTALSLAVIVLLFVDPFLSLSIGFQLSVLASLGILLISPALRIETKSRVARSISEALAVTTGAQLAVAPLIALYFGSASVVSFPANLAAGWMAGLIMAVGVAASLLALILPDGVIGLVAPILNLGVDYLQFVAEFSLGFRSLGLWFGLIGLVGFIKVTQSNKLARSIVVVGLGVALMTVMGIASSSQMPDSFALHDAEAGNVLWVSDAVTNADVSWFTSNHVKADIVVSESGSRLVGEQLQAIQVLVDAEVVLAPSQHSIPGARRVVAPLDMGALRVVEEDSKLVLDGVSNVEIEAA